MLSKALLVGAFVIVKLLREWYDNAAMKRSEILLMMLQVPLDFLMLLLAGMTAYALRASDFMARFRPVTFDLLLSEFLSLAALVGVLWLLIFGLAGLYTPNPNRKLAHDMGRIIFSTTAGLAIIAVYVMFTLEAFDSRFLVAAGWVFGTVYVVIGRLLMRGVKALLYRAGIGLRRVAIIGDGKVAEVIGETLAARQELGFLVVVTYHHFTEGIRQELVKLEIDELFFINPRAHESEALAAIDFCNEYHRVFKYSADLFSTVSSNMRVHPVAGVPIIELCRTPLDGWGRVAKRVMDVVVSAVALIVLSPLMLISLFIILCETGRPIIYKNERVGIRGRRFFTLKFRSMYQKDSTGAQFGDAGKKAEAREKELIQSQNARTGPIYKIANDPRVTRFGRFMRRWSIDEVPQFWNVLLGQMSLVGPRPHQPREVAEYERQYRQVFTLKPGITGLAQISGRSDLSFEEEMTLDLFYIEHWTVFLDAIIFLKTPFIIFKRRKVA